MTIEKTVNKNGFTRIDIETPCVENNQTVDLASTAIVTPPDHGTTTIELGKGTILYRVDANYVGNDSFVYEVLDDVAASCGQTLVNILVSDENFITINGVEYCASTSAKHEHKKAIVQQEALSGRPRQVSFGDGQNRFTWQADLFFATREEAMIALDKLCEAECVPVSGCSIPRNYAVDCFVSVETSEVKLKSCWYIIPVKLREIDNQPSTRLADTEQPK